MKIRIDKILIAIIALLSFESCNNNQKEINVIYFAGLPMGQAMKEKIPEFTQKTGIKVNFVEIPYDNVRTKELTSVTQKQGAFDAMFVDDIWMYEYAKKGIIEPLDEYVKKDSSEVDYNDFLPKVREAEGVLDNRIWLMPQRADAQCLFYRKDLFENEKNKQDFKKKYGYDLAVPETWEQFKQVAEFFTVDSNHDGKIDLYGTTLTLKRPHFAFEFFAMKYWAFANCGFIDGSGNVLFDSKDGVNALLYLDSLKQFAPLGVSNWQHDEAITSFASGQTAMCPQWFAFYPVFNDTKTSKIVGKFGAALVPGKYHNGKLVRAPSIGGGSLGIAADSKHKQEAWEFIKFMTSKDFMNYAANKGEEVTRESIYGNSDILKIHPEYSLLLQTLKISWLRPRTIRYAELQETIGLAVSRSFVGEMTAQDALNVAKKDAELIIKKK